MRERNLTAMSPRTRAAYEAYRACKREDEAAGYQYWEDPEHPAYIDPAGAHACEEDDETNHLPPPGWGERKVEESEEENPSWRTVKDEGWE